MWSAFSQGFGESLGGVAASALGNAFGGGGSGSESRTMQRQWHYQKAARRELPTHDVIGLRAAGLNPILAATKGLNATNAQNVTGRFNTENEKRLNTAQKAAAVASIANIKADTDKKKSEKELIQNQTSKISVEKWQISEDARLKQKLQDKTLVEIEKIKNEAVKIAAEKDVAIATEEEIRERILKLKSEVRLNDQQLEEMFTRFPGLLIEKEIDKSTYGEFLRWSKRALPHLNSVSGLLGAIGIMKNFGRSKDVIPKKYNHGTKERPNYKSRPYPGG